jgi:hypothetical protein
MELSQVTLVMLGDNFPVSSIRVSDFQFGHRDLRETLRLPIIVQAEGRDITMQVVPERFEIRLVNPVNLSTRAEGIQGLADTFLEYVGRRTVKAVGHNAIWTAPVSQAQAEAVTSFLIHGDEIQAITGSVGPVAADVSIRFRRGAETQARLLVPAAEDGNLRLDFNFHFDLGSEGFSDGAAEAVALLPESLDHSRLVAESFAEALLRQGVQS